MLLQKVLQRAQQTTFGTDPVDVPNGVATVGYDGDGAPTGPLVRLVSPEKVLGDNDEAKGLAKLLTERLVGLYNRQLAGPDQVNFPEDLAAYTPALMDKLTVGRVVGAFKPVEGEDGAGEVFLVTVTAPAKLGDNDSSDEFLRTWTINKKMADEGQITEEALNPWLAQGDFDVFTATHVAKWITRTAGVPGLQAKVSAHFSAQAPQGGGGGGGADALLGALRAAKAAQAPVAPVVAPAAAAAAAAAGEQNMLVLLERALQQDNPLGAEDAQLAFAARMAGANQEAAAAAASKSDLRRNLALVKQGTTQQMNNENLKMYYNFGNDDDGDDNDNGKSNDNDYLFRALAQGAGQHLG